MTLLTQGVQLIAQEREEQIRKHGRTIGYDYANNTSKQLAVAATKLVDESVTEEFRVMNFKPGGWDQAIWEKMARKSYKERLIIAGALLAAEFDRVMADAMPPVELPTELDPDAPETEENI